MPLYDFDCQTCGTPQERYVKTSDTTPTCEICGGSEMVKVLRPRRTQWSVDPVVIYEAPDGTIRVPPDMQTETTAMYDRLGYKRVELRGAAEVRPYERYFNKQELARVQERIERQQAAFEQAEHDRRSEINRCLDQGFQIPVLDEKGRDTGRKQTVRLTARGREILRQAQGLNANTRGPRTYDPGCHFEAYSYDRSNREDYSDGRGRRSR